MTDRFYIIVTDKGRRIRADYPKGGGPYIDLTFLPPAPSQQAYHAPTEVINVYDYAAGRVTIPATRTAVRAEVLRWIADNDEEWPEWYDDYLANASYVR